MYDFEAAVFAQPGGGEVALIPRFALEVWRFESHVADFEDLDRDAVVFVFAQRLQQAGKEGGADDLIFCGLWVGEFDGRGAVVDAVEVGEVFGVRAEGEGEHFGPAGHGGFETDDVAEFVDGERLGDCA